MYTNIYTLTNGVLINTLDPLFYWLNWSVLVLESWLDNMTSSKSSLWTLGNYNKYLFYHFANIL